MTASKRGLTALLFFAILTFWSGIGHAGTSAWPNSKGEICLENTTTGRFVKLAVVRVIGNHFAINGIVTDADGSKTLVSGSAEVDGDGILMHITASGYAAGEVHGLIGSAQLDASTLDGFFVGIGLFCDPVNAPGCAFHNEGIQQLEHANCQ